MTRLTLALDVMGGDFGPSVTVPAALQALNYNSQLTLLLVGDPDAITPLLAKPDFEQRSRLQIIPAQSVIASDARPEEVLEDEKQVPVDICNHALLVGFGRVGSLLGEKLMAQGIPLVVVETSRTRVDELRERGISAVLGNAANEEIMELAHLDCARWLLLTIPNGYEAGEIVASAREKCPNIEIIARAHYDDEVDYIIDRGANQVVMGEREIARAMLRLLETPPAGEVVTG